MADIMGAIRNTVSLSLFNRGLAGKIFEDVKKTGAKVVMKNNAAECVLLSPEEYASLVDEINDARLLLLAYERTASSHSAEAIPAEQVYAEFGITAADLADCDEVEIE